MNDVVGESSVDEKPLIHANCYEREVVSRPSGENFIHWHYNKAHKEKSGEKVPMHAIFRHMLLVPQSFDDNQTRDSKGGQRPRTNSGRRCLNKHGATDRPTRFGVLRRWLGLTSRSESAAMVAGQRGGQTGGGSCVRTRSKFHCSKDGRASDQEAGAVGAEMKRRATD